MVVSYQNSNSEMSKYLLYSTKQFNNAGFQEVYRISVIPISHAWREEIWQKWLRAGTFAIRETWDQILFPIFSRCVIVPKCTKSLPAWVFLKFRPMTILLGILVLDWNCHGLEELGLWMTGREGTGGGWWTCGPACYFVLDISQMGLSRQVIWQQHLSWGLEGKRKLQSKLETEVVLISLSAGKKKRG